MNFPTGKGIFVWAIRDCQPGGDPQDIADRLAGAGIRFACVKIANGQNVPGVSYQTESLTRMLCARLNERNIRVWGWQYVLGENPVAEAQTAARIVKSWGLDGFAADMEGEFDTKAAAYSPGVVAAKASRAYTYCLALRNYLPAVPLALASYRYPTTHPYFPWQIRRYFDVDMPQVYWEGSTNPGYQVRRSYSEFRRLSPPMPFSPIGSAYKVGTWQATPAQIVEFLDTCRVLDGVESASFWELGRIDKYMPSLWPAIASYSWPVVLPEPAPVPPPPLPEPPPQEITPMLQTQLIKYDIAIINGEKITGSNLSGYAVTIPDLPAGAKGVKIRIVSTANRLDAYVFAGAGNVGNARFKVGTRQKVPTTFLAEPYEEANGDVMLDGDKLWIQHDARGGTIKYWLFVQGWLVE